MVLGPFREWNPDIAMRYLPIVRLIDEAGLRRQVTDIGSGRVGIAPYLKERITGVDQGLGADGGDVHRLMDPVDASVLDTPFDDRSRPCVISVDMLEHLPPQLRQQAVDELVRITGKLLVIAVPCGPAAEEHDREIMELFRSVRGVDYRFMLEHVENGLPSEADLQGYVDKALATHGRQAKVRLVPNANLRLRMFLMRRWIYKRLADKAAWVALTWLSPLLARQNQGVTYRQLAVVEFSH